MLWQTQNHVKMSSDISNQQKQNRLESLLQANGSFTDCCHVEALGILKNLLNAFLTFICVVVVPGVDCCFFCYGSIFY